MPLRHIVRALQPVSITVHDSNHLIFAGGCLEDVQRCYCLLATSVHTVTLYGSVGFLEVDKALGSSRIDCEFSGSTSVVSFLKGKTLTTAWVGDSRGVLGRSKKGGGYEAVPLTKDHKPTAPEEKARIVATNGRVER